jgi:hypothetical protein
MTLTSSRVSKYRPLLTEGSTLSLTLALGGWMANAKPWLLHPWKRPGTNCIGSWVCRIFVLVGWGKYRPHRYQNLGQSSPEQVATSTELSMSREWEGNNVSCFSAGRWCSRSGRRYHIFCKFVFPFVCYENSVRLFCEWTLIELCLLWQAGAYLLLSSYYNIVLCECFIDVHKFG